ncbi:hypothetical protein HCN44_002275 [Aphidius gifuensis]|uniref:Guanylate cyclase n=1 Tax=Aphidius gifuensis TaxID=684658 RepID=A0A835CU33_APHGI|nr:hypothetical protein HCN44_002275 [Aphidius gifuensis]
MARSRLHQDWLILSLILSLSSAIPPPPPQPPPQRPIITNANRLVVDDSNLMTSTFSTMRKNITKTTSDVVIFLRDNCNNNTSNNYNNQDNEIINFLGSYKTNGKLSIGILQKSLACESKSWGLGALVQVLEQSTTKALIAALDVNTCQVAERLAFLWNKPLLTWTCQTKTLKNNEATSMIRLTPFLPIIAQALSELFLHFKWKSVAVISIDEEPWLSLENLIIGALKNIGIIPRHHAIISRQSTSQEIHQSLVSLESIISRVIVLCIPADDEEFISRIFKKLETISKTDKSLFILVHPGGPELFLPPSSTTTKIKSNIEKSLSDNSTSKKVLSFANTTYENNSNNKHQKFPRKFQGHMKNLMVFLSFDKRYNLEEIYNGTNVYHEKNLIDYLNESLGILLNDSNNNNDNLNSNNNKMFTYALLDSRKFLNNVNNNNNTDDYNWQPLVQVIESWDNLIVQELVVNNNLTDEEIILDPINCLTDNDCKDEHVDNSADNNNVNNNNNLPLRTSHIVAVVLVCLLLTLLIIIIGILIRRHLINKRISKGPFKIILTASDFVFPHIADGRRVDEGIEAMLCCWLQQLQEFGGPEIEKPDLLQGSVGSLKPHFKTSTGSLSRLNIVGDSRARYNGDLVQLKEVPCQTTFELKSKAMDVLVMMHGLRHENLNPFIGCLTEPSRPCIVTEYCSRGSLEDVLVQDVKLDWSFRLSLLTDLVRGMKYLHNSPIRVHGYLTSRNCVIDARWVLKIADYGLPAFYEAQNIVMPAKTARDLLWTAPELLRHTALRKRGTQPGDVYSFGIIMQEVIVRGEPFCMLARSPEEIIEKVKKPPPLIRPSVSHQAAPPEAINIMRQCWAEAAEMRPDFNAVHDLFKKLNHGRKVNFVDTMFQMLEKYSNNLEELIRERTQELDIEKRKTEEILNRMLPGSVAEKLKLGMPVDPEEFDEVTIYFSDIVGFTTISANSTAFQVVDLLNDLYTCFDDTINAYTVYKVETIGDAYMVVGGCPVRIQDHPSQIATMALDLLHQSGKFKVRHLPKTQLQLRIGLHTGPCCAGIVGLTMPRYCLFGDTVNTASRMESTGAPWRIHLSQATRDRLTQVGGYHIEYRGSTDIKGKGKMPTYWLLGKQGFDKKLPTPPPFGLDESLMIKKSASTEDLKVTIENFDNSTKLPQVQVQVQTTDECIDADAPSISSKDEDENCKSNSSISTNSKYNGANGGLGVVASDCAGVITKNVVVTVHDEKDKDTSVITTNNNNNNSSINTGIQSASASRVAAALLGSCGASTTSLSSIVTATTAFRNSSARHRHRVFNADDLSSPYNHYRRLSPNEHGKGSSGRMLKRQFSLDRADEPSISIISDSIMSAAASSRISSRLYKQNSAGAANDLEKIEEVVQLNNNNNSNNNPATGSSLSSSSSSHHPPYRHAASMSLSVESLTMR